MNKKIFTLLVGAIMIIGSAFTVNAQTFPYSPKSWSGQTNFSDILTAETVTRLPAQGQLSNYYYLLSVTGVANPDAGGAALNTWLAGGPNRHLVLYVDEVDKGVGREEMYLRLEDLDALDKDYSFLYTNINNGIGSSKFGALRRSLWCVAYDTYIGDNFAPVPGSNTTYDFQNLHTGLYLEAPYIFNRDTYGQQWKTSLNDGNQIFTGRFGNSNGIINTYDAENIVSSWHFSQVYSSTQNFQNNMPLYSYVKKDSVAVLVLEDGGIYATSTGLTGGWRVTVKHVSVFDLIKDATGAVNVPPLEPGTSSVGNVLLFTLKKVNPFVLNADDWNSVNNAVSFFNNANTRVFNENYPENVNDPNSMYYVNPFTDNPLRAVEVNDSLYHYGYMQFWSETGRYAGNYLYVDTGFVNYGNTQYLAFAWNNGKRDNTDLATASAFQWGDSFDPAFLNRNNVVINNGMLDRTPYFAAQWSNTVYWRLDSIIWDWVGLMVDQNAGTTMEDFIYLNTGAPNYGSLYNQTGAAAQLTVTQPMIDAWNEIREEVRRFEIGLGITPSIYASLQISGGAGVYYNFLPSYSHSFGTDDGGAGPIPFLVTPLNLQFPGIYYSEGGGVNPNNGVREVPRNYGLQTSIYQSYFSDSTRFIYAYMKDSIMENQSKFRVVYDPYADSTYINVYQTRVKYPDLSVTNNVNSPLAWAHPWWTNSFGLKLNEDYPTEWLMTRPSDMYTGYLYGGIPIEAGGAYAQVPITEAARNYKDYLAQDLNTAWRVLAAGNPTSFGAWYVEGHGKNNNSTTNAPGDGTRSTLYNTGGTLSIYNFHSFMDFFPNSSPNNMDRVLISTADTIPIYDEYYTGGSLSAMSHMYGWSVTDGYNRYRDSLFYVDLQDLVSGTQRIITLDQLYKDGAKLLDTKISLSFGPRCIPDDLETKATIDNDLYLIRNTEGRYLSIPLGSTTDSVYWVNPGIDEDLTRMPSYQWAVINLRSTAGSPFRLINREFERVEFPYVYVYKNRNAPFVMGGVGPHLSPAFNTKNVVGQNTSLGQALHQGSIDTRFSPSTFVSNLENLFPLDQYSFIRLSDHVKSDHELGYKYIDKDLTYIDVYAFRYDNFLSRGTNNKYYLSWHGYEGNTNYVKGDTVVYARGTNDYDKLYFDLKEMEYEDIYELDAWGNGRVVLTAQNTALNKPNHEFYDWYRSYANGERNYTNAESIVMERFGFFEPDVIADLKPMIRQAYRLFLKDYYRWHPTEKGHYLVVGNADRYVLADKAHALTDYKKGSGDVIGLFGIPHFYFRNTYFDVEKKGDDFFAMVQRLDTTRISLGNTNYFLDVFDRNEVIDAWTSWWGSVYYGDIRDYLILKMGSIAAEKVLDQIFLNHEHAISVLNIDFMGQATFEFRGDALINTHVSTFQLEHDDDPIYRRLHWNEPEQWGGDDLWQINDNPVTVEFHEQNGDVSGYRLYENSGNYTDPYPQADMYGADGGRVYNRYDDGRSPDYFRDSLLNVISFLGINHNAQFGDKTNYAIFVDTAYINRGTGWIKPQYMLVVDPLLDEEIGDCDPATGLYPNLGNFRIGRYLFNSSQYAKAGVDSVLSRRIEYIYDVNGDIVDEYPFYYYIVSDRLYDSVYYYNSINKYVNPMVYQFKADNWNKVEPVKINEVAKGKVRNNFVYRNNNGVYNAEVYNYPWQDKWERLAFTWAIHKGDSLYVLKGVEPAYEGDSFEDPERVIERLVAEYGGYHQGGRYIDFVDKLINYNVAGSYYQTYYPQGDRTLVPDIRRYHTFKSLEQVQREGRTIGLQAIIDLSDNTHKDWVFSFRYIERGSSDFVIESETQGRDTRNSAIIRPGYGGWIKHDNFVPTISRTTEVENMGQVQGSVFNVKFKENPVANETVRTAASNVNVIAGTGSVTIQNAEGKNVVITNMLGQTVARASLTSNSATIAVPAGVAVVMVEGESAVKALVK